MIFNLIERLVEELSKYPHIPYELSEKNTVIRIPSSPTGHGFAMMAKSERHEYTVGFEGWQMVTSNDDSAFYCFMVGLSPDCRLKVVSVGSRDIEWQAEVKEGGLWRIAGVIKKFSFPFQPKKERILSNDWIKKQDHKPFSL